MNDLPDGASIDEMVAADDPETAARFDRAVLAQARRASHLLSDLPAHDDELTGVLTEVHDLLAAVTADLPHVHDDDVHDEAFDLAITTAQASLAAVRAPDHVAPALATRLVDPRDVTRLATRLADDVDTLIVLTSEIRSWLGHALRLRDHPLLRVRRIAALEMLLAGSDHPADVAEELARWEALPAQAAELADTLAAEWTESSTEFLDVAAAMAAEPG